MSLFLLQEKHFSYNLQRSTSSDQNPLISKKIESILAKGQNQQHYKSSIGLVSPQIGQPGSSQWHPFKCVELVGRFKGLFLVREGAAGAKLSIRVKLIGADQSFYKLQSTYIMPQIFRRIIAQQRSSAKTFIKIGINGHNREIQITLPDYFGPQSKIIYNSIVRHQGKDEEVFFKIVSPHVQSLKYIIKKVLKVSTICGSEDLQPAKEKQQLDIIQRYSEMSHAKLAVKFNSSMKKSEVRASLKQQLKKITDDKIDISPEYGKTSELYTCSFKKQNFNKFRREYTLSENELIFIDQQLEIPIEPSKQDDNIMKHIYLKNDNSINMKKINEGGFSDIYTAVVDFWFLKTQYVNIKSFKLEKQCFMQQNLIKRQMVIKKELPPKYGQQKLDIKSRIDHEIDILKTVRQAKPLFLPQYYVPINKSSFFSQTIFIDHIESQTLSELLHSQGENLSLLTKLYIMYSIAQSLRFLRDSQIVHLDLKPNNILLHPKMVIKLIDFGQSYHPNISNSEFEPGFTLPYSCPEMFTNEHFNSSSDVFSMGIIFFEMLYNKCPFNFFTRTTRLDSVMDNYEEKWFFSPEEADTNGEPEVFRILNEVISKCLSRRPEERPQIDWITVILRTLIDIVK